MLFSWLREWKRKRLREAPFPAEWQAYLERNVHQYRFLSPEEKSVLLGDLRVFMAEKWWEGCGGLRLTDEMKVTISAQACLLTLSLERKYYPNVRSILVYPSGYRARTRAVRPDGVVVQGYVHRLGEAWETGPVILSWRHALAGGRNPYDGRNLVLHEFAHKLDLEDGAADGYPRLGDDASYRRWFEVMRAEYDYLVEQSERGQATVLDHYGAEDASELFAVATEAFFERPRDMRREHGKLYAVLREFYRQDPATRIDRVEPVPEAE